MIAASLRGHGRPAERGHRLRRPAPGTSVEEEYNRAAGLRRIGRRLARMRS
ncbi:MAG TPA: hypothetical protein VMS88_01465 [Terriglobales bacterium]|nr:hypothetical protein [Terriglobales bacterium]